MDNENLDNKAKTNEIAEFTNVNEHIEFVFNAVI